MSKNSRFFLLGIVFLFLLQTISDFIESIYAFGLLQTSFTIEIASIVLFFIPLVLLFFRRGVKRPFLIGLALFGLVCRVVETLLPPTGKMLVSGLGMAALGLFLLGWLAQGRSRRAWAVGLGLVLALLLSIFLRTLGSGSDVSLTNPLVGLALAAVAVWALSGALTGKPLEAHEASEIPTQPIRMAFSRLAGLSVGVAGVFQMIYLAFASPVVIARWTGFSYLAIGSALVISQVVFMALLGNERFTGWLGRRFVLAWNALFTLALVLTILPHQVALPADPAAYPILAQPVSPLAALPLLALLALSPVVVVDLMLFVRAIRAGNPSTPQIGGAFSLAALYFLVMVFLHIFTTIYDYAPVVGPLFRDRFWLVYLLAGLGMGLPVLLAGEGQFDWQPLNMDRPLAILTGGLAVGAVLGIAFTAPRPVAAPAEQSFKVMTYNIQQGYAEDGAKNLAGQLRVIQGIDPDILGLQESDTARIANGNVDVVRYFADRLEMYSYYGPTTTTGTFGIALLSKFPIEYANTFFMYSEGEQTATIHAQITVTGQVYNVFVTHLGNGGPIFQLEDMLARIQGQENVIAMGDYNFRPPTEQYHLMTGSLADAWLLRWPSGKEISGYAADRRIDHVFVSQGLAIREAEYVVDAASDHPYMFVVVSP